MDLAVTVTYRCNARCQMCNTWQFPTRKSEEMAPQDLLRLPDNLGYVNVTGGEPMIREDIAEIIDILSRKARKVEISTNGYFTDRIVEVARRHPDIRIRVSVEGLPKVNDEIRGIKHGFDRALRTMIRLKELGTRDIGFGVVIQDKNAGDLLDLFYLCKQLRIEFGQSTVHNSHYFHKFDNEIRDPEQVTNAIQDMIAAMLRSRTPKLWFRGYLNLGIISHVNQERRILPCGAGSDLLFMDPFGQILPCNGMIEPMVIGNIRQQTFEDIVSSDRAAEVRRSVLSCQQNCWMVGTARPAMIRRPFVPMWWVLKNKARLMLGREIEWS